MVNGGSLRVGDFSGRQGSAASHSTSLNASKMSPFTSPAVVRADGYGGEGLFATRDIGAGEVVYIDTPLLVCPTDMQGMYRFYCNNFSQGMRNAMKGVQAHDDCLLPQQEEEICRICGIVEGQENAATTRKLHAGFRWFVCAMKCNAHGVADGTSTWALFIGGSRANHSCCPNVSYRNVEGQLCYVALRGLRGGEPITMTYVDCLFASTKFRKEKIFRQKLFACECPRCARPEDPCRRMYCPHCRSLGPEYSEELLETIEEHTNEDDDEMDRSHKLTRRDGKEQTKRSDEGVALVMYAGPDRWHCKRCGISFNDSVVPVAVEQTLHNMFTQLDLGFIQPDAATWFRYCTYLYRTSIQVLGPGHWLTAACHYLFSRYFVGVWYGGNREEKVRQVACEHADKFFTFVEEVCPEALDVDVVPWSSALMRMALYTGDVQSFVGYAAKYLPRLRLLYGGWDETVKAYQNAVRYLHNLADGGYPDRGVLYRYAEDSKRPTIPPASRNHLQPGSGVARSQSSVSRSVASGMSLPNSPAFVPARQTVAAGRPSEVSRSAQAAHRGAVSTTPSNTAQLEHYRVRSGEGARQSKGREESLSEQEQAQLYALLKETLGGRSTTQAGSSANVEVDVLADRLSDHISEMLTDKVLEKVQEKMVQKVLQHSKRYSSSVGVTATTSAGTSSDGQSTSTNHIGSITNRPTYTTSSDVIALSPPATSNRAGSTPYTTQTTRRAVGSVLPPVGTSTVTRTAPRSTAAVNPPISEERATKIQDASSQPIAPQHTSDAASRPRRTSLDLRANEQKKPAALAVQAVVSERIPPQPPAAVPEPSSRKSPAHPSHSATRPASTSKRPTTPQMPPIGLPTPSPALTAVESRATPRPPARTPPPAAPGRKTLPPTPNARTYLPDVSITRQQEKPPAIQVRASGLVHAASLVHGRRPLQPQLPPLPPPPTMVPPPPLPPPSPAPVAASTVRVSGAAATTEYGGGDSEERRESQKSNPRQAAGYHHAAAESVPRGTNTPHHRKAEDVDAFEGDGTAARDDGLDKKKKGHRKEYNQRKHEESISHRRGDHSRRDGRTDAARQDATAQEKDKDKDKSKKRKSTDADASRKVEALDTSMVESNKGPESSTRRTAQVPTTFPQTSIADLGRRPPTPTYKAAETPQVTMSREDLGERPATATLPNLHPGAAPMLHPSEAFAHHHPPMHMPYGAPLFRIPFPGFVPAMPPYPNSFYGQMPALKPKTPKGVQTEEKEKENSRHENEKSKRPPSVAQVPVHGMPGGSRHTRQMSPPYFHPSFYAFPPPPYGPPPFSPYGMFPGAPPPPPPAGSGKAGEAPKS